MQVRYDTGKRAGRGELKWDYGKCLKTHPIFK